MAILLTVAAPTSSGLIVAPSIVFVDTGPIPYNSSNGQLSVQPTIDNTIQVAKRDGDDADPPGVVGVDERVSSGSVASTTHDDIEETDTLASQTSGEHGVPKTTSTTGEVAIALAHEVPDYLKTPTSPPGSQVDVRSAPQSIEITPGCEGRCGQFEHAVLPDHAGGFP